MRIFSFRLPRNNHHQLAVDCLQTGLNVIHGQRHSGRSFVHQVLADHLYGTDPASTTEAPLPADILLSASGEATPLAAEAPAALAFPKVTADDLQLLRQHYSLESVPAQQGHLLANGGEESCICGQTHNRNDTTNVEQATDQQQKQSAQIKRLEQHRQQLTAALSQGAERDRHEQAELTAEHAQLEQSIRTASERQEVLCEELKGIEERIKQLESLPLDDLTDTHWLSESYRAQTNLKLEACSQEIDRWERIVSQVRQRRDELEQAAARLPTTLAPRLLREAQRTSLTLLPGSPEAAATTHSSAICNFLGAQEQAAQHELLQAELAGIRRAEAALSEHGNWLRVQRENLSGSLPENRELGELAQQEAAFSECRCPTHGLSQASSSDLRAELIELQGARQGHVNERQALRSKVQSWQTRCTAIAGQLASHSSGSHRAELQRQLTTCEQQLTRLRSAASQRASSPAVNQDTCLYLQRASELLQELTGGYLSEITANNQGSEAEVTDFQGQRLAWDLLSISGRNMVRLGLSLAAVEAWERYGLQLPLLLDDPFVHLKPGEIGYVAGVIQRFAHARRQVIVFTNSTIAQAHFSTDRAHLHCLMETPSEQPATDLPRAHINFDQDHQPVHSLVLHDESEQCSLTNADSPATPVEEKPAPPLSPKAKLVGALRAADIDSTDKFLAADLEQLVARLPDYTVAELTRWQDRIGLLHFVDDLTDDDVDVLIGAGVDNLEALSEIETNQFHQRMLDFLRSDAGSSYRRLRCRYTRNRVGAWRRSARGRREQCRQTSYGRQLYSRTQPSRTSAIHQQSEPVEPLQAYTPSGHDPSPQATRQQQHESPNTERKFYLELSSPVVDAPTIGPSMAKRLKAIDIHTVADLLATEAATIAKRLEHRRTRATHVKTWQQQATLVCRVPQLRGHDAQILVALGYTDPEQIAQTTPEQLYTEVKPFARSKQGRRFIREMNPPDLAEIKQWIAWTRESRVLKAA